MTACGLSALIGLFTPLYAFGSEAFPAKELIKISGRHQMPMPPKEARLVLAQDMRRIFQQGEARRRGVLSGGSDYPCQTAC